MIAQTKPPPATPPLDKPHWSQDPIGWSLVGGGAIGIGVGGTLLFLASSKQRDANSEAEQTAGMDLESSAKNLRLGGVIAVGVGGALLIGGVVKLALTPSDPIAGFITPTDSGAVAGFYGTF